MASKRSGKSRGSSKSEKTKLTENSKDGIDLTKEDEIKLDDKIELDDKAIDFDATSGELSTEKTLWEDEEDGESVSAVAGVDLIPTGISISASGDIGSIGVDLGLPGDVIGLGVNIQFDLTSGDIIGGGISGSYGGLSVGVDHIKKDGETCTIVTVTYMGIGANYQRCKKDDEDDEKDPPKPPPGGDDNGPLGPPPLVQIPGDQNRYCLAILGRSFKSRIKEKGTGNCSQKELKSWLTTVINRPLYIMEGNNPTVSLYSSETFINFTSAEKNYFKEGAAKFYYSPYGTNLVYTMDSTVLGTPERRSGTVREINQKLINMYTQSENNYYYTESECTVHLSISGVAWGLVSVYFPDTGEIITPPDPPPEIPKQPEPPIPPENDMSNCCNLEPVMSLLRKVSTAIGTDQLPANMPKSFLKNEGVRSIPSLAELQVYNLEIMDQLIGKFPIELEIKDTDPLTEGDQTKKITLNNLAESVAELFGLAVNSASDNAIQTSGSIKNLLEITLVRQAVLQNYYRLDAILDYLGAGLEEDEATFNSTISLPKDPNNISEDVAEFLQQSEIKFVIDKLSNPKDTLTAKLLPIQKAADIIKAKYWKGLGKAGGDYTDAIKKWLSTYDPKNDQNDTDWKDKIDKILEEYAKDQTGNIDKDRMPVIQNIKQVGTEPEAPPPGVK